MGLEDEIKAKTKKQAIAAMEEKTAIYLKKSWKLVHIAAAKVGRVLPMDPTDGLQFPPDADEETRERMRAEEWLRLGKELIEHQELTLAGIDKKLKLKELEGAMDDSLRSSLQVQHFQELVPTRNQVEIISETVAGAAGRSVGTGVEFLDGLFGGASLGDVFKGLFSWIVSFFSGGFEGLKESIAGFTGARMRENVTADLTQLQQTTQGTTQDVSGFLRPEVIAAVGAEVEQGPKQSLKGDVKTDPLAAIRDAHIGSIDPVMRARAEGSVRTSLFNALGKSFKENEKFKHLYKDAEDGLWTKVGSYVESAREVVGYPSHDQQQRTALDKVQFEVAARMAAMVVDPDYTYQGADENLKGKHLRDMTSEARAKVMREEAQAVIHALGEKPEVKDKSFYAFLEVVVPAHLEAGINEAEKSTDAKKHIPWHIAGDISKTLVSAAAPAKPQDEAVKQATAVVTLDLQREIRDQVIKDGVLTEAGAKLTRLAGADLNESHFARIAAALSPVMLPMALPEGIKEVQGSWLGVYEEAALRFRNALRAGSINDPQIPGKQSVNFSPEALDVLADRMALAYAKSVLKMEPNEHDPDGVKFLADMKKREEKAAAVVLLSRLGPVMDAKKADLNALIDPVYKAELKIEAMRPEDMTLVKEKLAGALLSFAMDENFLKDVGQADNYALAHAKVSDKIFEALMSAKETLPLTEKGMKAFADQAALAFVEQQIQEDAAARAKANKRPLGSVAVPQKVAERIRSSEQEAVADIIGKSIELQLTAPAMREQIITVNNSDPAKLHNPDDMIKTGVAADAVKGVIAEFYVKSKGFTELKDADFSAFARTVRSKLEEKRKEMGVIAGQSGDGLLDVMAYTLTTGSVAAARKVKVENINAPADVKEMYHVGMGRLAERMVPVLIRNSLMPKLNGTGDEKREKESNVIVANLLAIDAARSNLTINQELIVQRVSEVVLYQQLKHEKTGAAVNEEEMRLQLVGALSGADVGLGDSSVDQLAGIIAKQSKKLIEDPTAKESGDDLYQQANDMLASFRKTVSSSISQKLASESDLSDKEKAYIIDDTCDLLQNIVIGNEGCRSRDNPAQVLPFHMVAPSDNQKFVRWYIAKELHADLNGEFDSGNLAQNFYNNFTRDAYLTVTRNDDSTWRAKVSRLMGDQIAGEMIRFSGAESISRWGSQYVEQAPHAKEAPAMGRAAPGRAAELRAEQHRYVVAAIAEYQKMQGELAVMRPSVRALELAVDGFEDRFGGKPEDKLALAGEKAYRDNVRALVAAEEVLARVSDKGGAAADAARAEVAAKFKTVITARDAYLEEQLLKADESLQQVEEKIRQSAPKLQYVTLEDHIAGNPNDATVQAIVALQQGMDKRTAAYRAGLKALEEKDGAAYQEVFAKMTAIRELMVKGTATPADLKQYAAYEGATERYQLRQIALRQAYVAEMEKDYQQRQALYAKLPDGENAAAGVKQAAAERMKKKRETPEGRAAFIKQFEAEMKTLQAAIDSKGMVAALGDVARKAETVSKAVSPEAGKDPLNPAMPLMPENLMARAAFAYPDKTTLEREKLIRAKLKSWGQVKPERSIAGASDAEKGLSDATRAMLTFIDQTDLYKVQVKGATVMQYLDDKKLPRGAEPSGELRPLQPIFDVQSFETSLKTEDMKGGKYAIAHLTPQGKKDVVELAAALQRRIDHAQASPEDKEKYGIFLEQLRDMVKQRVASHDSVAAIDPTWREVSDIINDKSRLAAYMKGEMKLAVSKQAALEAMTPAMRAFRDDFDRKLQLLATQTPQGLTDGFAKGRAALALNADGSKPSEVQLAEMMKQPGLLPVEDRAPSSVKSPIVPENLMAKMAIAHPEMSAQEQEEYLRKVFPHWAEYRPAEGKPQESKAPGPVAAASHPMGWLSTMTEVASAMRSDAAGAMPVQDGSTKGVGV